MKVLPVVGARLNVIKAAPVIRARKVAEVAQLLGHIGQHHELRMCGCLFEDRRIPALDFFLGVGQPLAPQTAPGCC